MAAGRRFVLNADNGGSCHTFSRLMEKRWQVPNTDVATVSKIADINDIHRT